MIPKQVFFCLQLKKLPKVNPNLADFGFISIMKTDFFCLHIKKIFSKSESFWVPGIANFSKYKIPKNQRVINSFARTVIVIGLINGDFKKTFYIFFEKNHPLNCLLSHEERSMLNLLCPFLTLFSLSFSLHRTASQTFSYDLSRG